MDYNFDDKTYKDYIKFEQFLSKYLLDEKQSRHLNFEKRANECIAEIMRFRGSNNVYVSNDKDKMLKTWLKQTGSPLTRFNVFEGHQKDLVNFFVMKIQINEVVECEVTKGCNFKLKEDKRQLNKNCRKLISKIHRKILDNKREISNGMVIMNKEVMPDRPALL